MVYSQTGKNYQLVYSCECELSFVVGNGTKLALHVWGRCSNEPFLILERSAHQILRGKTK